MTFNGLYDEISTLLLSNGTISSVVVQDVLSYRLRNKFVCNAQVALSLQR